MKHHVRIAIFCAICAIFCPLIFLKVGSQTNWRCLFVLTIMGSFWACDILPYGITSMIPVLAASLTSLCTVDEIAQEYARGTMFLCLGRFILACTYQKHELNRRFGLLLLSVLGPQPRQMMLACMLPSYVLTMFISGTATVPMMLDFVSKILTEFEAIREKCQRSGSIQQIDNEGEASRRPILPRRNTDQKKRQNSSYIPDQYPSLCSAVYSKSLQEDLAMSVTYSVNPNEAPEFKMFGKGLLLSTGYAASCGAVATIVASSPCLIFYGVLQQKCGVNTPVNYLRFSMLGLPLSLVAFLFIWIWIGIIYVGPRKFFSIRKNTDDEAKFYEYIKQRRQDLGPMKFSEMSCIMFTAVLIICWFSRNMGDYGWGRLFVNSNGNSTVSDAIPAILVIILIFIWPAHAKFWEAEEEERFLTWDFANRNIPWSIIFLLGSGFAMTKLANVSGLATVISSGFSKMAIKNTDGLIVLSSVMACLSAELLSSTSVLPIYLSLFIGLSEEIGKNPLNFMFPLTFSSCFAFCLPAATTPNIAIFNNQVATVREMIKVGVLIDILFILLVYAFMKTLAVPIFDMNTYPLWFRNCSH